MAPPASPLRRRRRRGLYPLEDTELSARRLREQYDRVLAPLSLFPSSRPRAGPAFPGEAAGAASPPKPPPVPLSLPALLQLVGARLELGPKWAHLPAQPQRAFREIILAEVRRAFKEVQRGLHDPAFGAPVNRELYQHLVMYVGLVCQQLFLHYLCQVEHRRALGVFTDCANLTRFSSQLALDCAGFLDMGAVRHRLVMEMKMERGGRPAWSTLQPPAAPLTPRPPRTRGCRLGFTISHFIRLTRPRLPAVRQKIAQDIKDLEEIPLLDMRKVQELHLPSLKESIFFRKMSCAAVKTPCPVTPKDKKKPEKAASAVHKKSKSLPNMRVGQLLVDELGIHITPRRLTPDLPYRYPKFTEDEELTGTVALAEDLRRLVQGSVLRSSRREEEEDEDLELPPLIKALMWRKTNEFHLENLQRMLISLQQEERSEMKRRNTIISAPASHPQATTVNVKVHNKMVVKAADLQVSERVYLDTVVLERCPPVYNHLLGEIDNATLKSLDASLSTGQEVRDIYKELMNNIPKDHLKFDVGPLIETPATSLDLSVCFASSTLTKRKSEQVINEELAEILPAGPFSPEEVVDTLQTPNLPFQKTSSKKKSASWLKWWKRTFNTDEFLKYIGTKESDFLPVIFHLYNVGGEEKEDELLAEELELKKRERARRDTIKKAAEFQFKKEKTESGMWDAKSITTGGLEILALCDHKPEDLRAMQRRLERLWTVLHFSEKERLDMAIKYSSNQYYFLLPDMLQVWEGAAQCIQERELLLSELEIFEQTASDPNRFFSKESQAFAMRTKESRKRHHLHSKLAQCDSELYFILDHIKEEFNDTVTFRGRPYLEKMQWDTVEMLYWLQQRRRGNALQGQIRKGNRRWKLSPLS